MLSSLRGLGKSEHKRIQEQLSVYLDGELSARDRAAVERHLQTCGECTHDLATLRWTVNLVREVPAVALPRSFTMRAASAELARVPRRAGSAYACLRGATALAAVLLALVLSGDVLSQFFTAAAPVPQVVEKEVQVEQAIVETVVVEKEVVMERPVAETVVLEGEKAVEKPVAGQEAKAITPPTVERALSAQTEATREKAMPEAQPTPSPPLQTVERALATQAVQEEPQKTDLGAGLRETPAPAPAATPPAGGVPSEATGEVAEQPQGLAAAAPTPTRAPSEVALELPEPSLEPPSFEGQAHSVPSGRGLSLLRRLEIGLLAAAIVLGVATLVARKNR